MGKIFFASLLINLEVEGINNTVVVHEAVHGYVV